MARIRDYLCLKKGIPLGPSINPGNTLYKDFVSLESLVTNLNQVFQLDGASETDEQPVTVFQLDAVSENGLLPFSDSEETALRQQ